MRLRYAAVAGLLLLLHSESALAQLRRATYVSGLSQPVGFIQDPGDPALQYVVQQGGLILVIRNGALQATPFLDVSSIITSAGSEQGLLGLAFHPNYATNGLFYVYYTASNGDNTLARFRVSGSNASAADPNSRTVMFAEPDRFTNHNGGNVVFGPEFAQSWGVSGVSGIRLTGTVTSVTEQGPMDYFIVNGMNGEPLSDQGEHHQYRIGEADGFGRILELMEEPHLHQGTWHFGEGTIHHQAFDVGTADN